MPYFRKKPVVIEARQWDGSMETGAELFGWITDCGHQVAFGGLIGEEPDFQIYTLEGMHKVTPGDYVIKGVHGEFYPCKPDIFEKTYEPV